jgi:hypothetical protein
MSNEILEFIILIFKFIVIPVALVTMLVNLILIKIKRRNSKLQNLFFICIIYPIVFYLTPFLEKLPFVLDYWNGMEETTQDYVMPTLKDKTIATFVCIVAAITVQSIINLGKIIVTKIENKTISN